MSLYYLYNMSDLKWFEIDIIKENINIYIK